MDLDSDNMTDFEFTAQVPEEWRETADRLKTAADTLFKKIAVSIDLEIRYAYDGVARRFQDRQTS